MIAAYIDEFIMFCASLWMSGVGYGFLHLPNQSQVGQQAWWAQIPRHFQMDGNAAADNRYSAGRRSAILTWSRPGNGHGL
jgi:hypothetical protein